MTGSRSTWCFICPLPQSVSLSPLTPTPAPNTPPRQPCSAYSVDSYSVCVVGSRSAGRQKNSGSSRSSQERQPCRSLQGQIPEGTRIAANEMCDGIQLVWRFLTLKHVSVVIKALLPQADSWGSRNIHDQAHYCPLITNSLILTSLKCLMGCSKVNIRPLQCTN